MNRWKIWIVVLVIIVCGVGCDQVTKHVAKQTLQGSPPQGLLYNTIHLQYTENSGAFLGVGAALPKAYRFWIFLLIPGLVMCAVGFVTLTPSDLGLQERSLLACLLSGGIGNLLDRAFQHGYVTDFMHLKLGPLQTGVFNVADVLIMIGAIGLALWIPYTSFKRNAS
jgi:signal peptidase II